MFKSFKFFEGQVIALDEFCRYLSGFGYKPQNRVSQEGEFARRGGLVDVYPVTFEHPVRIEWEGQRIQSVNSFLLSDGKPFWNHKIVILLPKHPVHAHRAPGEDDRIPLDSFIDIKKGDHVVHQQYGVGLFLGFEDIKKDGGLSTHMVICYAGGDKVFVPADQMHLVQKYIGFCHRLPKVHRLGSGEWKRQKLNAQKAVAKVALDLLKLQAMRKSLGGYAFSRDTEWQKDFEKTFPYTETPDQARAVVETKKDMESAFPMDRLLCGDVGYGKTEVAMRAAFKCVMDGKQVAFLVPTTILAEQHFQNFRNRVKDFPVRVEMLSRFRTAREQELIIDEVRSGKVDIVIGTHRLLSEDIGFKDLGLLIIDEEQRFGVKAKEKLKELRALVDVLTLTATPIPRTLYMSLVGAKDVSLIETPPENRMSVQTHIVEYDPVILRQALEREIKRRGQVFFVHNRVEDIEDVRDRVLSLCPPGTRCEFAHGQMPAKTLEKIMLDFLSNRIQVLVSTTIVESGIDVPNANTIILNNADTFGLADLHQLRGRVGRFTRKAYAYLVVKPRKFMNPDAKKRLEAIHEYSELGSGFKIAMQDLEIRGAGNILGLKQHGHIDKIGFDYYCRLLKGAIATLSA